MSPLIFKIRRDGQLVASARYGEDAAAIAGLTPGSIVMVGGRIVWREGSEDFSAAESYDCAAEIMQARRRTFAIAAIRKQHRENADEILRQLGYTD